MAMRLTQCSEGLRRQRRSSIEKAREKRIDAFLTKRSGEKRRVKEQKHDQRLEFVATGALFAMDKNKLKSLPSEA